MQKRTKPSPKRSSSTSDVIEVAAAIRKESRELCDELERKIGNLRAEVERSRVHVAERKRGS